MTKRTVTYARVSSNDKLKTGGENLTDQTRLCREYALNRGYTIIADLAEDDRGASGATFDLPELNKVLELARDKQFDVLIVRELDRLSRDLTKQLIVEQELQCAGVSIEYVLYDFPDTPEGRLNKNMRAMLAEYEREKIAQRMTRGRRRKARNGDVMNHGQALFGYRNVIKNKCNTLEINEEEAEIIRLVFKLYTIGDGEGPLSMRKTAEELDQRGILTYCEARGMKPRKGWTGRWSTTAVSHILKQQAYCGVWYYGDQDPIPVNIPEIIDQETWKRADEKCRINKVRSDRNTKEHVLLQRRLTCLGCGRIIGVKRRRGRKPAYRCMSDHASTLGIECTSVFQIVAHVVDGIAWEWIKSLLCDEETLTVKLDAYLVQQKKATQPLRERIEAIEALIAKTKERLEKLLDLYLDDGVGKDILKERQTQLERTLNNLVAEHQSKQIQLEAAFTADNANMIFEFARAIREELTDIDDNMEAKRRIINILDVSGEMGIEEAEKVLYLHCNIGNDRFTIASTPTKRCK